MKASKLFFPVDPEGLVCEAEAHLAAPSGVENDLEECLYVCGKGSRDRRFLRSIMYGTIGADKAKNIIDRDIMCFELLKLLTDEEMWSDDDENPKDQSEMDHRIV